MVQCSSEHVSSGVLQWSQEKGSRNKRMKLRHGIIHDRQLGVPAGTSRQMQKDFQLQGFWLYLVRGAWIGLVLVEVLVIIFTLLASGGFSLAICSWTDDTSCAITPATIQALHHIGVAPESYLIYKFVLVLVQSLIFLAIGAFIFWRKSSQPLCLAASFYFVSIGLWPFFTMRTYAPAVVIGYLYALCIYTAYGYFLVAFPDGRFVPRWSWLLVVVLLVQTIFFEIPGPFNLAYWPLPLFIAELLSMYGGLVGVQIYRYVRVSSYSQRQQTKWVVFGFAGLLGLDLLYGLIGILLPGLAAPDSTYQLINGTLPSITYLIFPLSVAIAIQRSRLWDIDVLIRRTLVYTILTVILALIYVGLVFVFGSLVRGLLDQQQNPLVIVASTLVIAALFQPLRHGIQRVIDRRFYRRKYDAAKTVEAFSATLRNEVDLSQLREHLLTVVQETVQPTHVSLWLRPTEHTPKQRAVSMSHVQEP
jgi:hypothetical protein